ncbi:MAG: pseudouridine synthase [Sphingomonadaceae bacterium]
MQQPNLALQRIAESLPPPKHKRSTDQVFSEPQRLHKVLASCGFGSRRAMEEMILAGRITVNRMPAEVGQKVGPGDEVRINGELVKVRFAEPRPRVLMYHKPAGELVTRDDPEGRPTVFEKLPSIGNGRWINVGRLDYNTEGLLLFTNSGELANRLMHPRYEVEREYAVRVMGRLTDEQMNALASGVTLEDGPARCESVRDGGGDEDGSNHWYQVVLKEGRNREVRRLFEALGLMVSRLIRTRFGALAMPTHLKRGQLTELEAPDVDAVMTAAGLRSRQPAAGHGPRPAKGDGGPRPGRGRAGPKHPQRPHGHRALRPPTGVEGGAAAKGESPSQAEPFAAAQAGPPRHPGQRPAKGPRPWKQRSPAGKPAQSRPSGGRAEARKPAKQHGQRPHRARHDFDEVQPQSNANASPFARTTLTVPGGAPRGYAKDGPRHRSGPRAQKAGANGHARSQGGSASYADRLDALPAEYAAPRRPVTQTQIRSKRTRTIVHADVAADARLRRESTSADDDES